MTPHNLPPYQRRDGETVAEKRERYRAEWAAAGLAWGEESGAANENAKPEPGPIEPWWQRW